MFGANNGFFQLAKKVRDWKQDVKNPESNIEIQERLTDELVLEMNCNIKTNLATKQSKPVDCDIKIKYDKEKK